MWKSIVRIGAVAVACGLMAMIFMGAEKPIGGAYRDSYIFEIVPDSTVLRNVDTFIVWTGTTGKLFRWDEAKDYSERTLRYLFEYTHFDTTTTGVTVDTSAGKDSVILQIWTADQNMTGPKLIFVDTVGNIHATAAVVTADYLSDVLSDSVCFDNLYGQVITILRDSTYLKARQSVGLTYKVTVWFWGR